MTRLEQLFQDRRRHRWSINEHMETLRHYGSRCPAIVEFGTDVGFSAVAFLAAGPATLDCYDIVRQEADIALIAAVAAETGTRFRFHHQSSLEAEFERADLLFIDGLHDYAQVKEELRLFGHKITRYLILHDTVERATTDETPSDRVPQGIGPAIDEYRAAHPEWVLDAHFPHQFGLTIYRREKQK